MPVGQGFCAADTRGVVMTIDVATMLTATTPRAEIRSDSATAGFLKTVISLWPGPDASDSTGQIGSLLAFEVSNENPLFTPAREA